MKKKYDATVAGEKYQNKQGEEKTRYIPVGAVFERPDGSMCMKLESIPVNFNGWINFYEPKFKDAKDAAKNAPSRTPQDFTDEIPFSRFQDFIGA
jgi:hypothetical protein